MAHEPQQWMKGKRRTNDNKGGMHVYIDEDTLRYALEPLGIPFESELEYTRHPMRDKNKRHAQVLIKIRATGKKRVVGNGGKNRPAKAC